MEVDTRFQSKGNAFYNRRIGRAPASKLKAICSTSTDDDNMSISLLKSITATFRSRFKTAAIQYGCTHETDAIDRYKETMFQSHVKFTLTKCGTFYNPKYPEFIATPDVLVECACCGKGCCEVKCPYTRRDMDEEALHQELD
ncbi:hypothetical protein FOCC_FOCC013303 [Frankliniella occidentalis]|nr:hypothetical protein FOCC_FOCC013303 [Frankliniella occidentalis]